MRSGNFFFALSGGLLLLLGLFWLLNSSSVTVCADPGAQFASPTGSGSACSQASPCALQTALGAASDGDILYLAGGVYTSSGGAVVTVTKSITLAGGWDGAAAGPVARDPDAHPTTLDGERQHRVIYVNSGVTCTIDGFIITRGQADKGSGIYALGADLLISGNIITGNVAQNYGGGVYVETCAVAISGNAVLSNSATYGGGGLEFVGCVTSTLHANRITGNKANYGGGVEADRTDLVATSNLVLNNQSTSAWVISGSGYYLTATNNIVADNDDVAFDILQYEAYLIHNTIAGNSRAVEAGYTATVSLVNNVIANHSANGVYTYAGATVIADHNLFWNNGADSITGTNAVLGDPSFVNPTLGDYHIGPGSAALDAGANAGVTTDIDGDLRPSGPAPDIGADEWRCKLYLPLVLKN